MVYQAEAMRLPKSSPKNLKKKKKKKKKETRIYEKCIKLDTVLKNNLWQKLQ